MNNLMHSPHLYRIAVIGLDAWGASLACMLALRGFEVIGLDPLRTKLGPPGEGVRLVRNLEQAVENSDVIITCFPDQLLMTARLCSPETTFALHGKALISFNTSQGRPASSARSMGEWARSEHIDYLEISVISHPENNSADNYELACAGPQRVYDRLKALCSNLGAPLYYLGGDYGAPLAYRPTKTVGVQKSEHA